MTQLITDKKLPEEINIKNSIYPEVDFVQIIKTGCMAKIYLINEKGESLVITLHIDEYNRIKDTINNTQKRATNIPDLLSLLHIVSKYKLSIERHEVLGLIDFSKPSKELLMIKALIIGGSDELGFSYLIEKARMILSGRNPLDYLRRSIYKTLLEIEERNLISSS